MNKIRKLESDFLKIENLKKVLIKDCKEELIDLKTIDSSWIILPRKDNIRVTGNTIFLRKTVANKLKRINKNLEKSELTLKIVDGYRLPEVQKEYWDYQLEITKKEHPERSKKEIENEAIKFCANPELSYHPTGGAVDLTLVNLKTKKELPMGTKINDFSVKSYAHFPDLSENEIKNRENLFKEMNKENFYNYPAEWWHFSYGTTDWALFYKKTFAIYSNVNF